MPYTPASPTVVLCVDLVTYLRQQWGPSAPSSVNRGYGHVRRVDLAEQVGRQVVIFPIGYTNGPAERGHDFYEHRIGVVVFEKYPDAAGSDVLVPDEWIDERVDWVNQFVVEGLDFTHDETYGAVAPFNRNLQTLSNDVPEMFDAEKLVTDKQFWCSVEIEYRELILS